MTMKNIEEKARLAYWQQKPRKAYGLGSFTEGYKDGFVAALNMVSECLSKPNNKEKIDSITKLIEEYGNEGGQDKEKEVGA